jgi:hypothetical protein
MMFQLMFYGYGSYGSTLVDLGSGRDRHEQRRDEQGALMTDRFRQC